MYCFKKYSLAFHSFQINAIPNARDDLDSAKFIDVKIYCCNVLFGSGEHENFIYLLFF